MPYRVTGCVTDAASGKAIAGLLVRAFDRDLVRDDPLGRAHTDADGRFEIVFTEVQFRDFNETLPDVYISVFDRDGASLLHTTRSETRRNTRTDEHFEIRLTI